MITTSLYLDQRYTNDDEASPVKLVLRHKDNTAMIATGIMLFPDQWKKGKCIGHQDAI